MIRMALLAALFGGGCDDPELRPARAPAEASRPQPVPRTTVAAPPRQKMPGGAPVLLPPDPALQRKAQVRRLPGGYSATVDLDGAAVEITGLSAPGGASAPVVQRTEYGFDASFARGGAVYNVSLTCDAGPSDRRCREPAFIRQFVGALKPRL